jgi:MoaA/NifB/PqqE/SkfB family radical SAM enzyme
MAIPLEPAYDARYGFGGRLSPMFPSQVIIDVTELCNLACVHCPHPDFKRSPHYAGRTLPADLNRKAIDEVAGAGAGIVQQVRYTGEGEPFLHTGMFGMLSEAVERSRTFISVTTNGTLLTDERIERLLATCVNLVDISIDALTEATYARIRVRGDLSVTRRNVQRLIARKQASSALTRIVVSYVEQADNAHETAAFEQFWRGTGADDVVVRRLHSSAGAVVPVADLLRKRTTAETRRPCVYPWERITLTPAGKLSFCPSDWTYGSALADYRDLTIAELWRSRTYAELRAAHLRNDYRNHAFCGQCPDWQNTRWPHEGDSYATLVERMREVA